MVRRAEASGMFQAYEMHTYIISIRFSRTMLLQPDPTRIEEQHGFSTDSAAECRDLTAHAREGYARGRCLRWRGRHATARHLSRADHWTPIQAQVDRVRLQQPSMSVRMETQQIKSAATAAGLPF